MVKGEMLFLLIVVFVSPEVFSLSCQRPPTPEECLHGPIPSCAAVDVKKCTAAGGKYLKNGSFCQHCDICGKDVDAGEGCHNRIVSPKVEYLTGVCLPPYVCSLNSEGVCVRPEECEYDSPTTSH